MRCEYCGAAIVGDPTFCASCCKSTRLLATELSAGQTLRDVYADGRWKKQKRLALVMLLPLLAFFASFLFLRDSEYYLSLLVLLPLLLAPLAQGSPWYKKLLRFFPFAVCFVCYLFALRLLCQGDHILNLVYLIMCNYGLSLCVPLVTKMSKGGKLLGSMVWSIKKIKESRWQQIFLLWALFVINILAIVPLGLGLLFSVPFSYQALSHYGQQLEKYYQDKN